MSRDEATLLDLLAAAERVIAFRGDLDRDGFFADLKTQAAVLHQLLLLGEGAKRLSAEFRAQHAEIPWRSIAGMRDHLVHKYDDVDPDEVWATVTRDVPALVEALRKLVPEREAD
jgi:uncharacterized protein with HEPN domain